MKKKIYLVLVILCSFFLLTCCQNKKTELETQQEKIYQLALSAGYTGTYEEWLDTIKGVDGTSIEKVEINILGELIITLSNGKITNLGNVKGSNGVGIDDVRINELGELIITYTDGQEKNLGIVKGSNGTNGTNGSDGNDGTGISNIVVNESGELVVTLSDGTIKNLGIIKGKDGENGQNGENGIGITNIYIDEDGYFIIELSDGTLKNLGKFGSSGSQDEEIVPVYQGMTLESNEEVSTYNTEEKNKIRKNGFKESIDDYLDIITTEKVEYYAEKGETFNVVVHIYNPQNYEILSFTLNGYKYQSYEFKEGSNSTRLIIEVNAGFVSGLKEYTIDAIKYINGTEIKDVQMDGEKTVKAGVRYEIVPTASIVKEEIGTTSYQSIVEIKDDSKLMDQLTGMHFFVFDGYSIIAHQTLKLGLNNIKIDDLAMGSNYEFMVVGVYDDYSGRGKRAVSLIDNNFTTLDGYLFESASSTQSQIKIKLKQQDSNASFKSIDLFKDNILVETKDYNSEITFDDLLSNNEYMVKVTYAYLKDDIERISTISLTINTEPKQAPSISLSNLSSTKKEISYQLIESDIDNVKLSLNVSLFNNSYIVSTSSELSNTFTKLYSNMEYKVVFTYQYDLNDGLGVQTIVKEEVIKTKSLDTPTLDVKYQVTSTSISYNGVLTDIDNTFNSALFKLYKGDNLIESSSELSDVFDSLIPNTMYKLAVSYYYDLNDGNPLYNASLTYEIETLKQIPTINLNVSNVTDNSVKVLTSLNDPNVVGMINSIKLYLNDVVISENLNNDSNFIELLSNTTYKVVVVASYDLNDGLGSIEIQKELSFTTNKKKPVVNIDLISTKKSVSYQISYSDEDSVFTLGKIELLKDNQVITETTNLTGLIENLNPSTNYCLRLTYSYDINDGLGIQTVVKEEVIKTSDLAIPNVGINFVSVSDTQITAKIVSSDVDSILNIDEIQLFKNSSLINTYSISDLNENNELTIPTISNTEYSFVVKYSYSLDGGTTSQNSIYQCSVVSSKEVPIVTLTPYFTSQNSLSYNLLISDPNASGHVQMISLYSGSTFIKRLSESDSTIESLNSNTQYSIKVNYVYDFDDGLGSREINYSYNFTTLKQEPTISLRSSNITKNSIEFSYNLVDVDNALTLEKLELFHNNMLIQTYTEWNQTVFNELMSNNEYRIVGTFIKNINTGDETVVRTLNVTTQSLEKPSVDINLTSTRNEISYNYVLNDPDKVSTLSSIDIYYQGNKLDNKAIDSIFANLYTDSLYEVVITLLCDYQDGKLPKEERYTKQIKTESYVIPTVNLDLSSTEESINYSFAYSDPFNLINPVKINVYKGDELIKEITDLEETSINELLSNTLYTLELVYEYNLNDNRGTITENYSVSYSTLAYNVKVVSYKVLNELTPKTNEDINVLINIENRSNVKVEYVVVNGVKKKISGGDLYNNIIIIERSPKISGNYQIVVSKMGYILNGVEVEQVVESAIDISIEIMSRLDIISSSILDDSYIYKQSYGCGIVLTIDNPDNYQIIEFSFSAGLDLVGNQYPPFYISVEMIDNNNVYFNINKIDPILNHNDEFISYYIKSVKYIDNEGNLSERKYDDLIEIPVAIYETDYGTNSLVIHPISTPEEFMNMKDGNMYELITDLDFFGYSWICRDFNGYFDGRGHKISNISIIEENEYSSYEVGIFKNMNGTFKNVYFENIYMSIECGYSVYSCILSNSSVDCEISNVLFSGSLNFKPENNSRYFLPYGDNIFIVDHLNYNCAPYTGSNLISLEQFNNNDFRENILNWNFSEKEKENYDNFLYTVYQNSYIIINGYNGTNTEIVIPESINNLPVIGISDLAFEDNTTIKSIEFPETLLYVGSSTLKGCYNIETIIIGEIFAFMGNSLMQTLFGRVSYNNSYYLNTSSINAYIPNSLKEICAYTNKSVDSINSFYRLISVSFNKMKSLEKIDTNYPIIHGNMFYNCSNLENIVIPKQITEIGLYTFDGCNSLTNVFYQGTIEDWCQINFSDSSSNPMTYARNFYILDENGDVDYYGNKYKLLNEFEIPETVTSVDNYHFYEFDCVKSLVLSRNIERIQTDAFMGYDSLNNVYYKGSIEDWCSIIFMSSNSNPMYCASNFYILDELGDVEFNGYKYSLLTELEIPSTVTSIGDYQFYGFNSVNTLIINSNLESIGVDAINGHQSLETMVLPSDFSVIDFSKLNLYKLENVFYNGTIEDWCNINFDEFLPNPDYYSEIEWMHFTPTDSLLYNPMYYANEFYYLDANGNVDYNNNKYKMLREVEIPSSITSIGNTQFCSSNITSIVIPNSVTRIGHFAFYNCKQLSNVSIPDGLESLGLYAFGECKSLHDINLPDSVTGFDFGVFANSGLTSIEIPNSLDCIFCYTFSGCSSLSSVVLPNNLKSIYPYAFSSCENLTSIEIPNSLITIDEQAFAYCTSLNSIIIPSSVTYIGPNAFSGCENLTIKCVVSEMPSGWDYSWNPNNRPVIWEYKEN